MYIFFLVHHAFTFVSSYSADIVCYFPTVLRNNSDVAYMNWITKKDLCVECDNNCAFPTVEILLRLCYV